MDEELLARQQPHSLEAEQSVLGSILIDPEKINKALGWLPETMFAEGIKKTIRWYLDNSEWCERILNGEYVKGYEKYLM